MSIIESAAKRLEKPKRQPSVPAAPVLLKREAPADRPATEVESLPGHGSEAARYAGSARRYAEVDLARLHEMGMVVSDGERTRVAEEFRLIKRPLLRRVTNARTAGFGGRNPPNLIMITSSLPKEGKTFCAINLAMSIATEKDHRVLLVDADVARPSVLKTLDIDADIGLMDILQDPRIDVADTLIHTNIPSLSIIGAGKSKRYTTELLASKNMMRFVEEVAKRYPDRIVIFDSPPLLATTEAQVLAMHIGQLVVVVEAEHTLQNQLKEALRLVADSQNVSVLYNKARRFSSESRYGYY